MDIEKFTRAKCAAFDVASSASVAIYNTNPGSESDLAFHEKSMTDSFHRLASALGYVAMTQAGHDNLLGFVEEVRDYRPDVISGRAHDPQDEVPDMIEADTFYAFQKDAAKLAPKPTKPKDAA